ncbi:hypothetical protein [Streptomyces sp. NBC_00726]|uniref:hypothetical protein n=1 Tax=Streptomyces sp. NBC_00726 TaxID=2903674 RepID=UPI003868E596
MRQRMLSGLPAVALGTAALLAPPAHAAPAGSSPARGLRPAGTRRVPAAVPQRLVHPAGPAHRHGPPGGLDRIYGDFDTYVREGLKLDAATVAALRAKLLTD